MNKQLKFKNNIIVKRSIFLIILGITFYSIFNFSSQNAEISGSLSEKITTYIVKIIAKIKIIDDDQIYYYIQRLHPILRKFAHFSIYAVVGFSLMGFMCTFDMRNIFKFTISLGIGIIYAITDEIHQYFTPGRCPAILDVCIDSAGVFIGIFSLIIFIVFFEAIINWFKR